MNDFLSQLAKPDPNETLPPLTRPPGRPDLATIRDLFLTPTTAGGFILTKTPGAVVGDMWRCERFPTIVVAPFSANEEASAFSVGVDARKVPHPLSMEDIFEWFKSELARVGGRIERAEARSIFGCIDIGPTSREEAIALARGLARRLRKQLEATARE